MQTAEAILGALLATQHKNEVTAWKPYTWLLGSNEA
jgi:hypothetical protein